VDQILVAIRILCGFRMIFHDSLRLKNVRAYM